MRKSLAITSLCLIAAVTSLAQADENDLFSSVRTESVFEPSTGATAAPAPARRANPLPELEVKISNSGELARKLRLAGLQVEEDSENRMVSTKTKLGQWTFPVLIVISEDGSQLMIALLLDSVSSEDQIPKDKLLELLQANRKYAPASFGYSSSVLDILRFSAAPSSAQPCGLAVKHPFTRPISWPCNIPAQISLSILERAWRLDSRTQETTKW